MILWSLVLIVTAIACAALYYAGARSGVNAPAGDVDSPEVAHLRQQLHEIDNDADAGHLQPAEKAAARAEVAREMLRLKAAPERTGANKAPRLILVASVLATAVLSLGVYSALGRPDLPAEPLAMRTDVPPKQLSLEDAVAVIEARLKESPDDMRGWRTIAPAYMQLGRYGDAAEALRKVIAADGATAELDTKLGEAMTMMNGGQISDEALALFKSAIALDPETINARLYVAEHATSTGDLETAKAILSPMVASAKGDEPWLPAAQAGLAIANGDAAQMDDSTIRGMVDSLSARLESEGGTIEEWTRLVRSRLVLGQSEEAQKAYDAARLAYPDAATRQALDVLAADNGLVMTK